MFLTGQSLPRRLLVIGFYTGAALFVSVILRAVRGLLLVQDEFTLEGQLADEALISKWQTRALTKPKKGVGKKGTTIEICCSDLESALAAVEGGATSVELCANRSDGGVTPSVGFVSAVVERLAISDVQVHVLIRPRPGGFCYTAAEFDVILRDICSMQSCGVDGIVLGILNNEGGVDVERMRIVREYCSGLLLTFHRAFDVMISSNSDPEHALQRDYHLVMEELGCDRLLTSGRSASASSLKGIDNIAHLVALDHACSSVHSSPPGKVTIAAGGISLTSLASLIRASGVNAVHLGSSVCELVGSGTVGASAIPMGPTCDGRVWSCVQSAKVRQVVAVCEREWGLVYDDLDETPPPPPSPDAEGGPIDREVDSGITTSMEQLSTDSLDSGEVFTTQKAGSYTFVKTATTSQT